MQIYDVNDPRLNDKIYIGIVEDINDPLKSGRVKVRIFSIHDFDKTKLKTQDLNWATPLMPVTSASLKGVGETPNLLVGSMVAGQFLDPASKQNFLIMGSILRVQNLEDGNPDLNEFARNNYPDNKAVVSKSGHIFELDDTLDNERVNLQHRSGSGFGINKDGDVFLKGKEIKILGEEDFSASISGDFKISASGDVVITGSNIRLNPGFGVSRSEFSEVSNFFQKNIKDVANSSALLEENSDNPTNSEQLDNGVEGSVCYIGKEKNPYDYAEKQLDLDWTEKSNPRNENIGLLWKEVGYNPNSYPDSTAWCAIFLSATLKRCNLKYLKTASSRQYANFGTEIESTYIPSPGENLSEEQLRIKHLISKLQNASKGDILVFSRGGGLGHVGFYNGIFNAESGSFGCIGGNQGNRLKLSFFNVNATNMPLTDIRRATTCKTADIVVPEGCDLPIEINDFDNFQIFVRNLYFEARSETDEGIIAVANIVKNRAKNTVYYGDTNDFGSVIRKPLQFSWYNKGVSTRHQLPTDIKSWVRCCEISKKIISNEISDNTDGALMYYSRLGRNDSVEKSDRQFINGATIYPNRVRFTIQIGSHRFFKFIS